MPRIKAATFMLSLATLCVPALAQGTDPAVRDNASASALNYVQGQVTLDGEPVTTNPNSEPRQLPAGAMIATTNGSADIMLAPGALLRIGHGTDVQFVTSDGHRAEVRLEKGRANVAVNNVRPGSLLLVDLPNGQTQILKSGLYTFDTASQTVRVFNGEVGEFPGANINSSEKPVKVKEGKEVVLSDPSVRPVKFDRDDSQDGLLPWTGAQETQAAMGGGAISAKAGYAEAGYAPAAYGYGSAPYAYGDDFGYGYGYGLGYPYGLYGYPYGFYGAPFGLGLGIGYYGGYGGFYGRGYGYGIGHGYGYGHGYGVAVGHGYGGGVASGHSFGGGGFHGGGGGGFHGGGGGGHR